MPKSNDFFALPDGAEFPQGDKLLRYTRRINDLEMRVRFLLSRYDEEISVLLDTMTKMLSTDFDAHCRLLNAYVSVYHVPHDILADYRELRALRPVIRKLRAEYDSLLDSILGVKL